MASFRVGDWLVAPTLNEIERDGERVHIEPRSMEVLECLAAAEPARVVPKEELIHGVWGDAFVGDEVLTHAIWELRKAFGDDARDPRYIQTIPKRGYRLLVECGETGEIEPSHPPMRPSTKIAVAAVVLAVLLGLAMVAALNYGTSGATSTTPPRTTPDGPRLILIPKPGAEDPKKLRDLIDLVEPELTGIEEFSLVPPTAHVPEHWARAADEDDRKLTLSLVDDEQGVLALTFDPLVPGRRPYGDTLAFAPGTTLQQQAEAVRLVVSNYGKFAQHPLAYGSDLAPWIDPSRHNLEALLEFLKGAEYTLNFQGGGFAHYVRACELDENFVAPAIWGIASLSKPDLEGYLTRLQTLSSSSGTSDFEGAVIAWASSFLQRDFLTAARHLERALGKSRDNGPTLVNLALTERIAFGPEEALAVLEPLVERRWQYASVYPQASQYAVAVGRPERAREILTIGLEAAASTIDSLALLEALAWLDDDEASAVSFSTQLAEVRKRLPQPEVELKVRGTLESLAALADEADNPTAAKAIRARLSEFQEKS